MNIALAEFGEVAAAAGGGNGVHLAREKRI